MAKKCEICGKGPLVGNNVSHSHNKTKKRSYPNIQKVKVTVNNTVKKMNICTRCLKKNMTRQIV